MLALVPRSQFGFRLDTVRLAGAFSVRLRPRILEGSSLPGRDHGPAQPQIPLAKRDHGNRCNGGRCHVQHVASRRAPWPESPGPGRHAPPLGSGARERLLFGPGGRRCCGGRASRPHPWRSGPTAGSACNAAAQPHGRSGVWRRGGNHNVHNVATSPITPHLRPCKPEAQTAGIPLGTPLSDYSGSGFRVQGSHDGRQQSFRHPPASGCGPCSFPSSPNPEP